MGGQKRQTGAAKLTSSTEATVQTQTMVTVQIGALTAGGHGRRMIRISGILIVPGADANLEAPNTRFPREPQETISGVSVTDAQIVTTRGLQEILKDGGQTLQTTDASLYMRTQTHTSGKATAGMTLTGSFGLVNAMAAKSAVGPGCTKSVRMGGMLLAKTADAKSDLKRKLEICRKQIL